MEFESRPVGAVSLVVPGSLDTLTGGYLYDRRIFGELAAFGWDASVVSLDRSFPRPTGEALAEAEARLAGIPDRRRVVIDGLALAGLLPLLPSIVARLDTIALIHHPLADETGLDEELAATLESAERAALALVPRIVVTSRWTRQRLADYAVEPGRVTVIEPGVDRGRKAPRAASADSVRLLAVASITPRKGHLVLIDALARLDQLSWSLRLVGSLDHDRPYAESVRRRIAESGLSARVEFLGELAPDAVSDEYAGADLFVLPSFLEGYGMALAEAVAHGLPVVSTSAGAIPGTVPANAGRLVPPGDVDALAAVLDELIGNPAARRELARGARAAADRIPTWSQAANRFADMLAGQVDR